MLKKRSSKKQNWLPDYYAQSVVDIDFNYLRDEGFRVVMLDLDHTILAHGEVHVEKKIIKVLKNSKMELFIATNRRQRDSLDAIRRAISAKGVVFADGLGVSKPSSKYYRKAIDMINTDPSEVIMIGDRLVQDIWGANRVGITTVMVAKFGRLKWYDQFLTVADRLLPVFCGRHYRRID